MRFERPALGSARLPRDPTTGTEVAGTEVAQYPAATDHYGLLWWNNADGRMASVPKDAYWAWGLGDSLIVVIPSLDVVVARAGQAIRATPATDPRVLEPFIGPIVASTRTSSATSAGNAKLQDQAADHEMAHDMTGQDALANAPLAVDAGADQTLVLPQDTIALAGSIRDDGRSGGAPMIEWKDANGIGAIFLSPSEPTSLVTFPRAGTYVLELSANDGEQTAIDAVTVTVVDPAAPPAKMPALAMASIQFTPPGAAPVRATWLAFGAAVSSDGAVATLRVRIAKVLTPGRIEVHRVWGPWDARSLRSSGPPPIDPVAVASYTVEPDDAGLALETDVSDAVSSWTGEEAARGLVLIGVTADVVIATDAADASAEIRLDR